MTCKISKIQAGIIAGVVLVVIWLHYLTTSRSVFANQALHSHGYNKTSSWTSSLLKAAASTFSQYGACKRHPKPNLIVSSIDGPVWQDAIYKFMESLEVSLAKDVLRHFRNPETICPPAPVHVKIIVPSALAQDLSPSFMALKRLYPDLDFPAYLPDIPHPSVLTRFMGWANLLNDVRSQYDRVLTMDLDLIFQRNPFTMRMPQGADVVFFKEWRGMKLGQQTTHHEWHQGCQRSPGGPGNTSYESGEQHRSYAPYEIICDGTTYGTADGMRVYLRMMASDIQKTAFGCNDQAMHQHIYYTGLLNAALREARLGSVVAVSEEEGEVGTIGWVPMVMYNHAGEVVNENGEVQAIVHQYKAHPKLVAMFNNRFAWLADPGVTKVPHVPELAEDVEWTRTKLAEQAALAAGDPAALPPLIFKHYYMQGVHDGNCSKPEDLCSCWFQGCHFDYTPHIVG